MEKFQPLVEKFQTVDEQDFYVEQTQTPRLTLNSESSQNSHKQIHQQVEQVDEMVPADEVDEVDKVEQIESD